MCGGREPNVQDVGGKSSVLTTTPRSYYNTWRKEIISDKTGENTTSHVISSVLVYGITDNSKSCGRMMTKRDRWAHGIAYTVLGISVVVKTFFLGLETLDFRSRDRERD